ncbi:unnamed protein product [Moneuplotes crassus]|uniref:Uncharacterized protein n=1 Tax=Euplotes crassus TaxID=5936 RepID=A0AAD1Y3Y6_EUPCR|nr:unnamed protein product [Moneuplotes crassus]
MKRHPKSARPRSKRSRNRKLSRKSMSILKSKKTSLNDDLKTSRNTSRRRLRNNTAIRIDIPKKLDNIEVNILTPSKATKTGNFEKKERNFSSRDNSFLNPGVFGSCKPNQKVKPNKKSQNFLLVPTKIPQRNVKHQIGNFHGLESPESTGLEGLLMAKKKSLLASRRGINLKNISFQPPPDRFKSNFQPISPMLEKMTKLANKIKRKTEKENTQLNEVRNNVDKNKNLSKTFTKWEVKCLTSPNTRLAKRFANTEIFKARKKLNCLKAYRKAQKEKLASLKQELELLQLQTQYQNPASKPLVNWYSPGFGQSNSKLPRDAKDQLFLTQTAWTSKSNFNTQTFWPIFVADKYKKC